jgi:transcriptional regulator with PAS, ATPase and Fis domain
VKEVVDLSKIAFIAPDKQLFLQGKKIAQELGLSGEVFVYLARLKRAVRLAERLQHDGTDVIISRGGTAKLIIEAKVKIPVVEIVITGQDLAQALGQVKKITGLAHPNVLILGFSNMMQDIETLADVLNIKLTCLPVLKGEDIPLKVEEAARLGADIVVGGIRTITLAAKKGLKTHLIASGYSSIQAAFVEAKKVALGRKIEKEHSQQFKILVECSSEGIISINREQIIKVFNPTAARLLNRSASEVIGQRIGTVFSFIDVETCLATGSEFIGQVINLGNMWINVNISPIVVDHSVIGAVVTFQDITRVQEIEAKIRNEVSARRFAAKYRFTDIIGISSAITETKRMAHEIAGVDATLLLSGKTGTGKELFAQSIHNHSHRKNGPFVAVNCAAIPQSLLESELFGYVEGAFTGATKKGKPGVFELAHLGTIFLDEISEMDTFAQVRLLRILQEKQVMRLGDNKYIPVDVRVIAATNKNLAGLVSDGLFRQDLFYRLKVLTLHIPSLASRASDIQYLAEHFLAFYNRQYRKQIELTPAALDYLCTYEWPGNVRELMHFMERIVVISKDRIIAEKLVQQYGDHESGCKSRSRLDSTSNDTYTPEQEKIAAALRQANSNISRAAEILKIDRSTLYRKLKYYKIEVKKMY